MLARARPRSLPLAGSGLSSSAFWVEPRPIHNDPDEARLIGAAHLLPAWMLDSHDAILAVDVVGPTFAPGSSSSI
jgi:hypothetical protein